MNEEHIGFFGYAKCKECKEKVSFLDAHMEDKHNKKGERYLTPFTFNLTEEGKKNFEKWKD